jgi:hypothetical protein
MLAVRSGLLARQKSGNELPVSLTTGLLRVLGDLERYAQSLKDDGVALANIRETRTNLQRLVDKMDTLEVGFDRIAERSRTSPIPSR